MCSYSKAEDLTLDQKMEFDYLIAEAGEEEILGGTHVVVERIAGFSGFKFETVWMFLPLPRLVFTPRVVVLKPR